jgi:hypothetical protein
LITTKQGSPGKVKVSYNGYYSWDNIAYIPDMQDAGDRWGYQWERAVTVPLSHPSNNTDLITAITGVYSGDETQNTEIAAFMEGYPGQTG